MLRRTMSPAALFAIALVPAGAASAQVTIQQPAFGVTSVATTVSVPDRGRAHLGSIGRAGEARTSTGPFRSGSNYGQFRDHSSMSVTATIHDFEAMDRHLLNQASSSEAPSFSTSTRDDDYRALLARNQRRGVPLTPDPDDLVVQPRSPQRASALSSAPSSPLQPTAAAHAARAERSFAMGVRAEERGAIGVAKVHFRIAVRHGHDEAESRLAALERDPSSLPAISSAAP